MLCWPFDSFCTPGPTMLNLLSWVDQVVNGSLSLIFSDWIVNL